MKIKNSKLNKSSSIYLDQFYTCDGTVQICLDYFEKIINNNIDINKVVFLEPSAGNGQFIKKIKNRWPNNQIISFDIEPKHKDVKKADFLKLNLTTDSDLITIGNPPFGYKSSLAIQFINHASLFSNIICFVLPLQFQRWNVQKQINPDLKLIFESNWLPKNSFTVDNKEKNINSIFQIWVNKNDLRFKNFEDLRIQTAPSIKHKDFILYIHNNTINTLKYFDKEKYKWDFAVVRQGFYNYKERIFDPKFLIKNRQYLFVKFVDEISNKIFEQIDFEKLSNLNTVIRGFSNSNVVAEYVKIKNKMLENKEN